jgi:multidrug efflux pump subunit AcrA (membrane-fusion protein)
MSGDPQHGAQPKHGRRLLWTLIAIVVLGLALLAGLQPHYNRDRVVNARAERQKNALPIVEVQTVHIASSEQVLTLPGTVIPLRSAHIYARASGYLKARYVDLGDTVRKGQLLAIISAPDLDASVEQQTAAVQQGGDNVLTAQSNLRLQQATYTRVHTLVLHGILSQQDDDTALAAVESARSNLQAMQNAVKGAQGALARTQLWLISSRFARPSTAQSRYETSRWAIWCRLREQHRVWWLFPAVPPAAHPQVARRAANCLMLSTSAAWRCLCPFRSRMRLRADWPACGPHLFGVAG